MNYSLRGSMSFVYFIQDLDTNLVRIGCTGDCPYLRLAQLRNAQSKKRFELLGVIAIKPEQNYYENTAKRELQVKFSGLRENGDWFRIGHDLANFIRESAQPHFCSRACPPGTSIYEERLKDQLEASKSFQKAVDGSC
jgi:hypothetical protein